MLFVLKFLSNVIPSCRLVSCHVMSVVPSSFICDVMSRLDAAVASCLGTGPIMSFLWCPISCITSSRFFLCYGVPCHLFSCYVSSLYSCHVVSCYLFSCRVMSCHVTSCRVRSSHVVSFLFLRRWRRVGSCVLSLTCVVHSGSGLRLVCFNFMFFPFFRCDARGGFH